MDGPANWIDGHFRGIAEVVRQGDMRGEWVHVAAEPCFDERGSVYRRGGDFSERS